MGKSRPDQVVVHRIELQQHERESLDTFLIGKTVTNGVTAVGALLAPFGQALGAIAAAWIAKEGIEKFNQWWQEGYLKMGERAAAPADDELGFYKMTFAYINASSNSMELMKSITNSEFRKGMKNAPNVAQAFGRWVSKTKSQWKGWETSAQGWPKTPIASWKSFFGTDDLKQAMIDSSKQNVADPRNWLEIITG
jgi:hypothetical protein